jgi:hypothetical protein
LDPVEIAPGEEQIPDLSVREARYSFPKVTSQRKVAHLEQDGILRAYGFDRRHRCGFEIEMQDKIANAGKIGQREQTK